MRCDSTVSVHLGNCAVSGIRVVIRWSTFLSSPLSFDILMPVRAKTKLCVCLTVFFSQSLQLSPPLFDQIESDVYVTSLSFHNNEITPHSGLFMAERILILKWCRSLLENTEVQLKRPRSNFNMSQPCLGFDDIGLWSEYYVLV